MPFAIEIFPIYYFILIIYCYVRLNNYRAADCASRFWYSYHQMVKIGLAYTFFGLICAALKFSVNLPRPFCSLPLNSFTTIADITQERCLSSFPSAHTGLAAMILYFLWQHLRLNRKILGIVILSLVGCSRITLAMHYPADILYGTIIGIGATRLSIITFNILKSNLIKTIGIKLQNLDIY